MHTRHRTAGQVRTGHLLLTTADGARRLGAGDCFFFDYREPHALSLTRDTSLTVLCFTSERDLEQAGTLSASLCRESGMPCSNLDALPAAANLHFHEKNPAPSGTSQSADKAQDSLIDKSIAAVMELLMAKPEQAWQLRQLANHAGYSPWYFLRGFHKNKGMTPFLIKQMARLHLLRRRLRTGKDMADLALAAGFSDQSHMHRVFKRYHGITPGQFRKASIRLEHG